MTVIRIPQPVYEQTHDHLFSTPGEHFAFLRARVTESSGQPVFLVRDVVLVPDSAITIGSHGYEIDPDALLAIVNDAIRNGDALVEAHNHGGALPRPSGIDRDQLAEFVPYILDSLPGLPYAATIWGETTVYGEAFVTPENPIVVRSITAAGKQLRQLVSRDDDRAATPLRFDRQLRWFTAAGQRQLGHLRIAVVGAGGTGSPTLIELAYLGARDILSIDPDPIDHTSLNRTMTATPADIDTNKTITARRTIKSIAPDAGVDILPCDLRHPDALDALKGADVIFGCVDNDGARLVLNELAVSYQIPYFDLGVGIEVENGNVTQIGGRIAAVLPGGPCLLCMNLLDLAEARYLLATEREQKLQRQLGYVHGLDEPAPAVISLNATIASLAVTELGLYVSGLRPIPPLTILDLLATGRSLPAQWLVPERVDAHKNCLVCHHRGRGDATTIERYTVER